MATDRREDAGDFYPRGRAVALRRETPSAAPLASSSQPGADAGDYYPGGSIITTRPVKDVGGDMKHNEFGDVEPVPPRFTDTQMRDKLNEVIGLLKGGVAVLALFALPVFAEVLTVQKAEKGAIYNDEPVVTNVVFDAHSLATTNQLAAAVAVKADAVKVVQTPQGAATNSVVYAQGARLTIKADVAPDGVRRWRLVEETR